VPSPAALPAAKLDAELVLELLRASPDHLELVDRVLARIAGAR
jgi:hypothetical protein